MGVSGLSQVSKRKNARIRKWFHITSFNFFFLFIPLIRKQDLVTQIISITQGPRDSATITVKSTQNCC